MRPNCPYEKCYCRAGKNGFCLKHKEIGEAIEALLLLSKSVIKKYFVLSLVECLPQSVRISGFLKVSDTSYVKF